MEANKTLLWAAPSSADCFSPLYPPFFSCRPFSVFSTDGRADIGKPAPKRKGLSDMKPKGMTPMQSQTVGPISVEGQEPQLPTVSPMLRRSQRGWIAAAAVFLLFAALLISGILERLHSSARLRTETVDMAVPTVSVVSPQRSAPSQEIVLPGSVQPYVTAPI